MRRNYRFAFVSNSNEIATTVKAFRDPSLEDVEIKLATMEEALAVSRDLLDHDTEVIIGGGATGRLLRKSLQQPVVTIARTSLDILRALIKARKISKNIVLTNFAAPTEGTDLFETLLDIQIEQVVFNTTAELIEGLKQKINQGYKVVVGSGICREICHTLSAESIIVYPSREAIVRAMEEARAIAQAQREQRSSSQRLNAILQSISEGVVAMDSDGIVTLLNEYGAKILNLNDNEVVGKPLPGTMRGMGMMKVLKSGEPDFDQIRRVAGTDIVVNTIPIEIEGKIRNVVSSFKQASHINSIDRKLKENLYQKGFVARYTMGHLNGKSQGITELKEKAQDYAETDAAVLVRGETGTGKELLAQAIHNASPRKNKPFIAVNCAALPESLLESELFGYEEGAFTGAKRGGKPGLFELANEGTMFLDEIADISHNLQVRLLRVIEEGEVMRVGGDRFIPVNIRLISATHRDLIQKVNNEKFRADLYFRLAVLYLNMPSLKERPEDIPLLLNKFLEQYGISSQNLLTPDIKTKLMEYSWPGNVRELDSLARRFAALKKTDKGNSAGLLTKILEEIRQSSIDTESQKTFLEHPSVHVGSTSADLKQQVSGFERETILKVLEECGQDRQEAAHRLGISVNTLWRKLKI